MSRRLPEGLRVSRDKRPNATATCSESLFGCKDGCLLNPAEGLKGHSLSSPVLTPATSAATRSSLAFLFLGSLSPSNLIRMGRRSNSSSGTGPILSSLSVASTPRWSWRGSSDSNATSCSTLFASLITACLEPVPHANDSGAAGIRQPRLPSPCSQAGIRRRRGRTWCVPYPVLAGIIPVAPHDHMRAFRAPPVDHTLDHLW